MEKNFHATNLNLVSSIALVRKLSQSKEEYLMLSKEEMWDIFQFVVSELDKDKTIGSQALSVQDNASNDVRPNDFVVPPDKNPPVNPSTIESQALEVQDDARKNDVRPNDNDVLVPPDTNPPGTTVDPLMMLANSAEPPETTENPMNVLADLATNLLKTNVKDVVVKYNGKNHIVRDVPLTHVVKHKSYVTKLENLSENWCNLKKARNQKKYSGSPIGRRLFGAAAAIAPQLSLHRLQLS